MSGTAFLIRFLLHQRQLLMGRAILGDHGGRHDLGHGQQGPPGLRQVLQIHCHAELHRDNVARLEVLRLAFRGGLGLQRGS